MPDASDTDSHDSPDASSSGDWPDFSRAEAPFSVEDFDLNAGDYGPCAFNFRISLSKEATRRVLRLPRREPSAALYGEMEGQLTGAAGTPDVEQPTFYEDTWLLHTITLPGPPSLGISGEQLYEGGWEESGKRLVYGCHNVSTARDATALLAAWLKWWETIGTLCGFSTVAPPDSEWQGAVPRGLDWKERFETRAGASRHAGLCKKAAQKRFDEVVGAWPLAERSLCYGFLPACREDREPEVQLDGFCSASLLRRYERVAWSVNDYYMRLLRGKRALPEAPSKEAPKTAA